jgi:hypothetical protein
MTTCGLQTTLTPFQLGWPSYSGSIVARSDPRSSVSCRSASNLAGFLKHFSVGRVLAAA